MNKENVEVKRPNFTSTGKATLQKIGLQIAAKEIPNPSLVGIDEANKKEPTIE